MEPAVSFHWQMLSRMKHGERALAGVDDAALLFEFDFEFVEDPRQLIGRAHQANVVMDRVRCGFCLVGEGHFNGSSQEDIECCCSGCTALLHTFAAADGGCDRAVRAEKEDAAWLVVCGVNEAPEAGELRPVEDGLENLASACRVECIGDIAFDDSSRLV